MRLFWGSQRGGRFGLERLLECLVLTSSRRRERSATRAAAALRVRACPWPETRQVSSRHPAVGRMHQVLLTKLILCRKRYGVSRKGSCYEMSYMSSRRNGGEGQEVRRETLTGGEELRHRRADESRISTARTKTELFLISVPVRQWVPEASTR